MSKAPSGHRVYVPVDILMFDIMAAPLQFAPLVYAHKLWKSLCDHYYPAFLLRGGCASSKNYVWRLPSLYTQHSTLTSHLLPVSRWLAKPWKVEKGRNVALCSLNFSSTRPFCTHSRQFIILEEDRRIPGAAL